MNRYFFVVLHAGDRFKPKQIQLFDCGCPEVSVSEK